MNVQVLVTYATNYGATAKIAERISQVHAQLHLTARTLPGRYPAVCFARVARRLEIV